MKKYEWGKEGEVQRRKKKKKEIFISLRKEKKKKLATQKNSVKELP